MFLIGLIIGCIIGACIGVLIASVLACGHQADVDMDKTYQDMLRRL